MFRPRRRPPALARLVPWPRSPRAAPAPPSPSSGRSRARTTSSTATPKGSRWTPRAACAWPPPPAPLHDPEAPYVWCARPRRQGRALRRHRQRRARSSASRTGTAPLVLRRGRARGARPRRGPGRPALRRHARPTARCTRSTRRARRRRSSTPRDKYIWALAFDRQGRLLVATGAEGTHPPRGHGRARREVLLTSPETPHHRAGRRRRRATSTRAARPAASSIASTPRGRCSCSTTRPSAR